MTTISDKDRAEAQAMGEAFHGGTLAALHDDIVRRWLTVRDHVLAAHECPTVPVWRPTTADEIQPGWEVRSRGRSGVEGNWGIAHHQNRDGNWHTEAGAVLTAFALSWTYETTAPEPEPEPWDEALVGVVSDALAGTEGPAHHWDDDARRVLDALAARGYLERAAITGGGQSGCTCVRCAPNYHLMRGCPTCGNKRCPKVSDHDNRCTGSNEPGQIPERADLERGEADHD